MIRGIAADEARPQARHARALGEAVEHHAALEAVVAGGEAGLEEPRGRGALVQVDLGVALVGGNDEVVPLGEGERTAQKIERQHPAGRVPGAAQKQHLTPPPDALGHGIEIGQCSRLPPWWRENAAAGSREQRRSLVDLIEGIRHQHQRVGAAVDGRLYEGEEGFAGAVDRQHHVVGLDASAGQAVALLEPTRAGRAQLRKAGGARDRCRDDGDCHATRRARLPAARAGARRSTC